jgi:hypothetical protein
MSLRQFFPSEAPSGARRCDECNGRGDITERWPDGDVRFIYACRPCRGTGHVLCGNAGSKRAGCTEIAVHFFDKGEDTLCDFCWTHCEKCGEKLVAFPDEVLCPVCDADELRDVQTAALVAAVAR